MEKTIDELVKLDKSRRNLMLFTTVLLFLSLTNISINDYNLMGIKFDLKSAPENFNTFNELSFYVLTYFFIEIYFNYYWK